MAVVAGEPLLQMNLPFGFVSAKWLTTTTVVSTKILYRNKNIDTFTRRNTLKAFHW